MNSLTVYIPCFTNYISVMFYNDVSLYSDLKIKTFEHVNMLVVDILQIKSQY